jgi:hypothetical protein
LGLSLGEGGLSMCFTFEHNYNSSSLAGTLQKDAERLWGDRLIGE